MSDRSPSFQIVLSGDLGRRVRKGVTVVEGRLKQEQKKEDRVAKSGFRNRRVALKRERDLRVLWHFGR